MPRSHRSREARRRPGQHHSGDARRGLTFFRTLALLLSIVSLSPAQTLLRIHILEGEGSVHGAGSKSERPLSVRITDETGRPLEGVAVSFRLPEEGPSGVFEGGIKTDISVTTPDGRAAVHGLRWNRSPGPFQIRITAAKGESRAGTICSQYISDTPAAQSFQPGGRSRKKWIALAAIAAAGAAAGVGLGFGGKVQQPGQAPAGNAPVSVGPPTISIGNPKP